MECKGKYYICQACKRKKCQTAFFKTGDISGRFLELPCKTCFLHLNQRFIMPREWSGNKIHKKPRARLVYKLPPTYYSISNARLFKEQRRQEGRAFCDACGVDSFPFLYVDHDHRSGLIRGLLCGRCNYRLGIMHDSVEAMEQLIAYLTK